MSKILLKSLGEAKYTNHMLSSVVRALLESVNFASYRYIKQPWSASVGDRYATAKRLVANRRDLREKTTS